MTRGTTALSVEIRLPGARITDQNALFLECTFAAGGINAVQKSCDVSNLLPAHVKFRHAPVSSSILHNRRQDLALLIIQHQWRAQQIGPDLAAMGIRAMAEGAVGAVQLFA